jgi:phospholipid/cholesterol/gamma-HCH transport system permease protein
MAIPPWLQQLGRQAVAQCRGFMTYLAFIGELTGEALRIARRAGKWRVHAIAAIVYRSGYQALPIIALLSFMIGVVIAYQLGLQLRNYGANVYIVDLLGLSILREFGPLITAIMVAGRTGSAFTAQLGMMKLDREIDTLNTMGVTPAELLLLPRIIGLLIALPLLTFWADIFGVVGGMVMSSNMLGVTWYDFLHRFPRVIPLKTLFIGLGKAPLFALIISSVGCFEGMRVESNVNSIGLNTTRSVVSSIFFVIVVDAILSIIFSKLKL